MGNIEVLKRSKYFIDLENLFLFRIHKEGRTPSFSENETDLSLNPNLLKTFLHRKKVQSESNTNIFPHNSYGL